MSKTQQLVSIVVFPVEIASHIAKVLTAASAKQTKQSVDADRYIATSRVTKTVVRNNTGVATTRARQIPVQTRLTQTRHNDASATNPYTDAFDTDPPQLMRARRNGFFRHIPTLKGFGEIHS